jgi:hypothetical protein
MTFNVLWVALPAGFVDANTMRVSLVASPRPDAGGATFATSPLADWPALVADLDVRLAVDGEAELRPMTRIGDPPSSETWKALFSSTTKVRSRGRSGSVLGALEPGLPFVDAAAGIAELYDRAVASSPTASLAFDHPVTQLIDELADVELDLRVAPARRPNSNMAPIAAYATSSLGVASDAARRAPSAQAVTSPLAGIGRVNDADFSQVVGLVHNHPTLSLRLGLRFDFEVAALADGDHTVRIVDATGAPLNGAVPRTQPKSRVSVDRARRRFVMASPDGADVRVGMLATTSVAQGRHLVTDIDVAGSSAKLASVASARAANGTQTEVRLPARRDVGITVAQRDRFTAVVQAAVDRVDVLESGSASALAEGEPVLFADDVTSGYRVDVSLDGGPFHSLMRRSVRYRVGSETFAADDEGKVEAITAVQQPDGNGLPALKTSEQLFTWNGFSLAAPKPGRKALGVAVDGVTTAEVENEPAPGYDLQMTIEATPGTVPRLRYGRTVQFRARAVDLAANAVDPDTIADDAVASGEVLPAIAYLRKDPVRPPTMVPRARFGPGESLERLVVRSTGTGRVLGTPCERHLAPPKASQFLAEQHGMFDAAMGRDADPAVVAALLAVARTEAGSVTDGGAGTSFVTSNPADPVLTALPPRGEPLPNGYYAVNAADSIDIAYLPDPAARGASIIGLPAGTAPIVAAYPSSTWPDFGAARLRVVASATLGKPTARVLREAGVPIIELSLPPGMELDLELASALVESVLDQFTPSGSRPPEAAAGLALALSSRQPFSVIHAVRQPVVSPGFVSTPTVVAPSGATSVTIDASVTCHRPTTSRIDVQARWDEIIDTGEGAIVEEARHTTAGSALIDQITGGAVALEITQAFDDTKHRRIEYLPVATTRHREYFDAPDGDPSLQRTGSPVAVSVPSRARPPRPEVHSIVPTFRWTRSTDTITHVYNSSRATSGVRVYLRRRWFESGAGELLGVVVSTSAADAQVSIDPADPKAKQDFVSQWGSDPLQELAPAPWVPMVDADVPGPAAPARRTLPLTEPTASESPDVRIVGHPVHFDAERNLWFADVDLEIGETPWPFVRLALVRYQPDSIGGCEISPVTLTDFVQLPPRREVTARKVGQSGVRVQIDGRATRNSSFSVRQERRIPDPLDVTLDLGSDAGLADGWQVTNVPSSSALAVLELNRVNGAPPLDATLIAQLRAGRIVVEEVETGWKVLGATPGDPGDTTTRTVWTEIFDRSAIATTPGGL